MLEAESAAGIPTAQKSWGMGSGMNGNTGMGSGYQGKWSNNNVGSGDYVKKTDCESERSGEGVGNTGNYPKWNHKKNGETGSGYDKKYAGNNMNTGNYYSNK